MPHMAPINWLSLFIMFSIIYLLFNMLNYYSITPMSPKLTHMNKNMMNSLNWKW